MIQTSPHPFVPWWGDLQIPVLKVALVDSTFFSRKTHPARILLNKLAEAGLGWGPSVSEDDNAYRLLAQIVNRIIDDFDEDISLFSEAAQEIERFLQEDKERLREEAQSNAASAAARDKLNELRAKARDIVGAALEAHEIPRRISVFFGNRLETVVRSAHVSRRRNS